MEGGGGEEKGGDRGDGEAIDTWRKKHRLIWVGATRHPFILSISDGTIDISAFKTWLGQDYIFVKTMVPFVASLIVKAWKEDDQNSSSSDHGNDVEVILSGLAAIKEELEWFKREANKWGVDLSQHLVPQKQNQTYCRFIESLMSPEVEYTVAITAFWAIETVYQESFAACLGDGARTPPELKETCERWGNEAFGGYCTALKAIANRRLKAAPDAVFKEAEFVFLRVLDHEIEFWNMTR